MISSLRVLDGLVVLGVLLGGGGAYWLLHELGHQGVGAVDYIAAVLQLALGAWLAIWALRRATRLRVTKAIKSQRGSPSA